jgi:hypothetical protein
MANSIDILDVPDTGTPKRLSRRRCLIVLAFLVIDLKAQESPTG